MTWLFGDGIRRSALNSRIVRLKNTVSPALLVELKRFCTLWPQKLGALDLAEVESLLGIPRVVLIPVFLRAVKAGIFNLEFRISCQGCKGEGPAPRLSDVHPEMVCPACGTHNHPELDGSVRAVFCLHPSLGKVKTQKRKNLDSSSSVVSSGLPAIEVINTQEFREFFEAEQPLPGEFVRVKKMCFLFTDIAGSTATYERLGDDAAFRLVREHFSLLFSTIKQHEGVVIKTIGDSVLASFLSSANGLACARDLQLRFAQFNQRSDIQGSCRVRVGVHAGPCVGVTLNQRLDFFGSTVNIAARVQAVAGPGQLCVTKKTAIPLLSLLSGASLKRSSVELKGISRPVPVILAE